MTLDQRIAALEAALREIEEACKQEKIDRLTAPDYVTWVAICGASTDRIQHIAERALGGGNG